MSANQFTFRWLNQATFLLSFEKLGAGLRDFRFIWPAMAAHFYQIVKETFATEGRSSKWPKLSEPYGKYKAAKYPGQPILQRQEVLIASLTQKGAAFGVYEPSPMALRLGSMRPGATAHQTGNARLPARPPIDITQDDFVGFGRILQTGLVTIATAAGFKTARLAA